MTLDSAHGFRFCCWIWSIVDILASIWRNACRLPPYVLQDKMQEYRDNGTELGWLIDPEQKRVYEYRMDREVRVLDNPKVILAEGLLEGFELDLERVWEVGL